jgi:hypothetical protein
MSLGERLTGNRRLATPLPEVSKYPRDRADTHKCDQREAGGSIGTMIGEAGGDCLMYGA